MNNCDPVSPREPSDAAKPPLGPMPLWRVLELWLEGRYGHPAMIGGAGLIDLTDRLTAAGWRIESTRPAPQDTPPPQEGCSSDQGLVAAVVSLVEAVREGRPARPVADEMCKAIDAYVSRLGLRGVAPERQPERSWYPSEKAVHAARAEYYEYANEYPGDVEMRSILTKAAIVDGLVEPRSQPPQEEDLS